MKLALSDPQKFALRQAAEGVYTVHDKHGMAYHSGQDVRASTVLSLEKQGYLKALSGTERYRMFILTDSGRLIAKTLNDEYRQRIADLPEPL